MKFPEEPMASLYFISLTQAIILVFLFLSLLFQITELTLFCIIMLVIGAGTYLWGSISRRGVTCRVAADKTRLFPGQPLSIGVHVINDKFLPALINVKLGVSEALTGLGRDQALREQVGLLWYQKLYFSKVFEPQKRGVYKLGPPDLRIGDLLGFFPKEKAGEGQLEILVYPRIVPFKPLPPSRREIFGIPGIHNPVEDPILVYGARDYQPASPARRILWKASARLDKLQEKLCEPAEQEKTLVVIDVVGFEAGQAYEAFEEALEMAASLLVDMARKGFATGLATNGTMAGDGRKFIPIGQNNQQISRMLEFLARLQMKSEGVLHELLARRYALPWGVSCVCFTHEIDDQARRLQAHFDMRKVPVLMIDSKRVAEDIHLNIAVDTPLSDASGCNLGEGR